MNTENLHELINRYEDKIDWLYDKDGNDELFKWRAMKVWRDEWFKPDDAFASFTDRFSAAKKRILPVHRQQQNAPELRRDKAVGKRAGDR